MAVINMAGSNISAVMSTVHVSHVFFSTPQKCPAYQALTFKSILPIYIDTFLSWVLGGGHFLWWTLPVVDTPEEVDTLCGGGQFLRWVTLYMVVETS